MNKHIFRIQLDLSEFFDDIRKSSYMSIYSTNDLIGNLIPRVKTLFGIHEEISFTIEGHYISNLENINILNKEDILKVHRINFSNNQEVNNKAVKTDQKELVIKKRKTTEVNNGENNSGTILNKELGRNEFKLPRKEQIVNEINKNDSFSTTQDESSKKKRRRIRKRKKNTEQERTSQSEEFPPTPLIVSSGASTPTIGDRNNKTFLKHFKFPDSDNESFSRNENETSSKMSNDDSENEQIMQSQNFSRTLDVICSLQNENEFQTPIIINRNQVKTEKAFNENLEDKIDKPYQDYPLLKETPKENMIIVFKILKLNENYMPNLSEYIKAKVLFYCEKTSKIKLNIIEGLEEFVAPKGKFDLENGDTTFNKEDMENIKYVEVQELIEARLIEKMI